ncbi:MAG: phosphate ABC transporter permease PstA [Lentisphaerae bacterium]|nr:phosphate ABC transporter permease PstA [Lentisphaerota bacterium]
MALLMVTGLVLLILVNGLGFFWPRTMYAFTLKDGRTVVGQITMRETVPQPDAAEGTPERHRIQIRQGNRDLYGMDFLWVDEDAIVSRAAPVELAVIERREWGNFHGRVEALREGAGGRRVEGEEAWLTLQAALPAAHALNAQILDVERNQIGAINAAQERIRLQVKKLARQGVTTGAAVERLESELTELQADYGLKRKLLATLREGSGTVIELSAAGDRRAELALGDVVRAYRPNAMGAGAKARFYASKLWEFVADDPRESNTEGGVFPAIFGTVMMVLIMSVIVTPLGVVAAFYLREYAKQGPMVSAVRIAVNNLAGVPSIVFGVFGVGFFIYVVGGAIDRTFFAEALPTPTFGTGGILWASLTLALLTVPVVIVATEEGLAAIPQGAREASLALGATKFETTWRVVLPAVMPSILTGLILAMARAAGEVAPLMITGVVKLAPTLPLDGQWPFVHLERKFMHLGFHIYDVGFQSPNVDAARPMVFMTAILLLLIVLFLNLAAILIRGKLRKKYAVTAL